MENKYSAETPSSFVDYDNKLGLETNNFTRKLFNLLFITILNNLPRNFKYLIKKTNKDAAEVIDNAKNHNALEVLYSKGKTSFSKGIIESMFRSVWFNINNSKAVRNRLKFVERELNYHLEKISKNDREINILSIASGSSRAIIETVEKGRYLDGTKLSITFLDKNINAIEYSKKLSTKISHLPIRIDWITDTAGNFLRQSTPKKYDIVEMVGLLDYFEDIKVVETFSGIYNLLQEGGALITANINHNKEEKFITKVIDWPMIYRTCDELAELVHKGGFEYNKMKVFYEPLKIHGLVVAKK